MIGYRNILCATDLSDHCRVAAQCAADLARCYGAQLTLLHVVDHFPEDRSNEEIAPEDADPATYRDRQARAALAELARTLGLESVTQAVLFTTQSAAREIVRYAEEQHTDLIVIASHGRHGITATLGSTAHSVAQAAPCDMLTVRCKT